MLNKLNGNLFSLAALYFTFAGAVVFSLAHIYLDRKEKVAKKDLELSEKYEKWFVQNRKCINLSVQDYYLNESMITKFNSIISDLCSISIISDLRKTLKYESVDKLRDFTRYYEKCRGSYNHILSCWYWYPDNHS